MLKEINDVLKMVLSNRRYQVISLLSFLSIALLYINASQLITVFPDGVYFEFSPIRIFTIAAVSGLFSLVVPLQIYSIKIASLKAKQSGATFGGVLTGMLGMSCCAPVIPSLLILLGFSGTSLLSLNTSLQTYLIPLSFLSIILLMMSLLMLSKGLAKGCKININVKNYHGKIYGGKYGHN